MSVAKAPIRRPSGGRLAPGGGVHILARQYKKGIRLDPHMHALSELGAEIDLSGRLYELQATRLQGANLFLDEASVMGTEIYDSS